MVVSGRSRKDVVGRLTGSGIKIAIGNHGAERFPGAAAKFIRAVARWKKLLERETGGFEGVWVEDKGVSLAVHYRHHPDKAAIRKRIMRAAQGMQGARIVGGKQVVNFVPDDAPHKGHALAAERERLRCDWALYVGDDDNDEDAFAVPGKTVGVRVRRKQTSRAGYYLTNQAEIDELLEVLASLRSRVQSKL